MTARNLMYYDVMYYVGLQQ